jgi:hypothetical protein
MLYEADTADTANRSSDAAQSASRFAVQTNVERKLNRKLAKFCRLQSKEQIKETCYVSHSE